MNEHAPIVIEMSPKFVPKIQLAERIPRISPVLAVCCIVTDDDYDSGGDDKMRKKLSVI